MKVLKRIISIICTVTMLVLCVPVSVSATTATKTKAEALSWCESQVGKTIEADGSSVGSATYAQCVDLTKEYLTYLGITPINGDGEDYATASIDTSTLTRLSASQVGTPQPGDIIIWKGNTYNPYGHVAICGNSGYAYHQNFGKVGKVVKNQTITECYYYTDNTYTTVAGPYSFWGVIRPKFKDSSSSKILTLNFHVNGGNISSDAYKSSSSYVCTSDGSKFAPEYYYNQYIDKDYGLYNASTFGLTRTGYTFVGWSTSKSGGTILGEDDASLRTSDITSKIKDGSCTTTLYAQWKPNTLTIKYHTNGGSIDSTTYSASSGKIYKNGSQYTKTYSYNNILHENGLTNASTFGLYKTGYTFTGWSTSKSGGTVFDQNDGTLKPTDITSKIKTGDATVTMYAQWEPNVLRIIYNVNGGTLNSDKYAVSNGNIRYATGKETSYKFEYNNILAEKGLYNASTFGLSRTGYRFVGWGTSKSGGTVFDENDVTLKTTDITSKIKSGDCTVTLYAQWEQIQDVNNDGKINQKDVTALSRYLAKGWSVAINQTPADTNGDGKINQKDVTVLSRYLAGGWGVTLA